MLGALRLRTRDACDPRKGPGRAQEDLESGAGFQEASNTKNWAARKLTRADSNHSAGFGGNYEFHENFYRIAAFGLDGFRSGRAGPDLDWRGQRNCYGSGRRNYSVGVRETDQPGYRDRDVGLSKSKRLLHVCQRFAWKLRSARRSPGFQIGADISIRRRRQPDGHRNGIAGVGGHIADGGGFGRRGDDTAFFIGAGYRNNREGGVGPATE